MPKFLPLLGGGFTALLAFVYSAYIHTFLFEFAGLGTGTNELGTSHCRRIDSLAGCEDFVLHESESGDSRQIYLACADPAARLVWSTVASKLNMTGRGTTDFMAALDLDALGDKPWDDSTDPTDARNRAEKAVRKLEFDKGFRMFSGEGNSEFSAHGVAMWEMEDSDKVRLFVVDHRPPRKGKESEGADSVVHLFETSPDSAVLTHLSTFAHPLLVTPNNLAAVGPDSFIVSNDHTRKTGLKKELEPLLQTPSFLTYCKLDTDQNVMGFKRAHCNVALEGIFSPGGVVVGRDGLVYASEMGAVGVYKPTLSSRLDAPNELTLSLIDKQFLPGRRMPIDNLVLGKMGEVYAAGFPKAWNIAQAFRKKDLNINIPGAVFRVEKEGDHLNIEQIWEHDGSLASMITSAVKDHKNGALYLTGFLAKGVLVCKA